MRTVIGLVVVLPLTATAGAQEPSSPDEPSRASAGRDKPEWILVSVIETRYWPNDGERETIPAAGPDIREFVPVAYISQVTGHGGGTTILVSRLDGLYAYVIRERPEQVCAAIDCVDVATVEER